MTRRPLSEQLADMRKNVANGACPTCGGFPSVGLCTFCADERQADPEAFDRDHPFWEFAA